MPLVTTSQMAYLRKFAELGMETDVTILTQTPADSPYSDDEPGTFTSTGTVVKGWLRSDPGGVIDATSGLVGDIAVFRLFVPYGTPLTSGDRVQIGGEEFIVQDTTRESTYQVLLRCSLRRHE